MGPLARAHNLEPLCRLANLQVESLDAAEDLVTRGQLITTTAATRLALQLELFRHA
jgi:hypothetical protein